MEHRSVTTAIPRFKLEAEYNMSSILQGLGMKRAFVDPGLPSGAQFPGMSASEDPTQQLFIGAVLHKAFVEVTEKGTEAAAATAVVMMAGTSARVEEMIDFTPVFCATAPSSSSSATTPPCDPVHGPHDEPTRLNPPSTLHPLATI